MTLPSVREIEAMDRAALQAAWSGLFATPVPKSLSQPYLRRFLAFEVQARRMGGLPKGFAADLQGGGTKTGTAASSTPAPGTRLLREWNGITHVVEVSETGILWNGETYRSLSSVARTITGARWSGPRFFGLTGAGP